MAEQKNCFFLSCETILEFKELTEILKSVRDRDVILLDEISFVAGWDRAVKHFLDSGFKGSILVTGSNSFDIRKGLDRMPGRWAQDVHQGEHFLLPMEFKEWIEMRGQARWTVSGDLAENFCLYFKVGGFPIALAEAGEKMLEPVHSKSTYLRWLVGDVLRRNRQEIYLRELLGQLALTITSPISLQKLAQKTQMMSYHTALGIYISVLEDCFALRTLYNMDSESGIIRFKKEKKFYFTDPIIYWIALDWAGHSISENAHEKLAEQVAHEFLARRAKRMGFTSTSKGEVDFFEAKKWAIEVKWANIPKNISKAYFDLAIPSIVVWSKTNFLSELPFTL